VSIKDFEKAKEVVLKMEEENIVPSPQILRGIYSQFKSSVYM
jgi:pentatricopeptide repeat protein